MHEMDYCDVLKLKLPIKNIVLLYRSYGITCLYKL